jgi:hypothetical protein
MNRAQSRIHASLLQDYPRGPPPDTLPLGNCIIDLFVRFLHECRRIETELLRALQEIGRTDERMSIPSVRTMASRF